uniref:HAMP domain-containing protein n=1 Tax=Thermogemmatispora argillosa TaxID=2045280 RepID=A0A455SZ00_9CHLR|nr:hypothetical protein KTA_11190 [Thermogemmatispora argillosa]
MSHRARIGTGVVSCLGLIMLALVLLPLPLLPFPLTTAAVALSVLLLAGALSLGAALASDRSAAEKALLPWDRRERVAWLCIAIGLLLEAVGVGWQLLSAAPPAGLGWQASALPASSLQLLHQLSPLAFALLLWLSLFLWPAASAGRERLLLILDVVVALLALLGLSWNLGIVAALDWPRSLGPLLWEELIRPLVDLLVIGAALLLLLRLGTIGAFPYRLPPRRASLLCLVAGLLLYALADLLMGRASAWSWPWPGAPAWRERELAAMMDTGLLLCGLAAYLRRVVRCHPEGTATPALAPSHGPLRQQLSRRSLQEDISRIATLPFVLCLPSLLLFASCAVLTWNAWQSGQRHLFTGWLLLGLAICGVCLRLLLTLVEQRSLARLLFGSYQQEIQQLEAQLYSASRRSNALEAQLARLREVLAQLAAGNLAARLEPTEDDLKPLAISLNQIADREMRLELWNEHNQLLRTALEDLCAALERCPSGEPLIIPASCEGIPQIERLLAVTGLRQFAEPPQSPQPSMPVSSSTALPPLFPPALPVTGESAGSFPPEHLPFERPSWPADPASSEQEKYWL